MQFLISESYSESEIPFIQVQTTLRDTNGGLIAYLESTKFTDINYNALGPFLETHVSPTDPIFEVNTQKFQLITRTIEIIIEKENVVASTLLFDNGIEKNTLLARFAHDGYPVIPGDVVTSTWTFVRQL